MRRGLQILILGFVLAGVAYGGFYFAGTARSRQMLQSPEPELAWLKQEYHLSDAEFARISKLHDAYLPQCGVRCQQVAEINMKLEHVLAGSTNVTPEIKSLLDERAQVLAKCQSEMLEHFYEVSRTMPEDEGKRYLAWVQQKTCLQSVSMGGHAMPPAMDHN